jgi:anti-sigma-K factor RskA
MSKGLSAEAARALFQRALDDDLSADEKVELEQALAEDKGLARELTALRELVAATSALSSATPSVDLLSSVQHKLRVRSGGRFYRDRFAEKQGQRSALPLVLGASFLVLLATVLWLSLRAGLFSP